VISVRLDCTPSILNAVLTPLLGDLPDVALVYPTSTVPDVAVVSAFAGTDNRLDWLTAAGPGRTIIALDSQNNTLRVCRGDQKATRERILAGTLPKLLQVLRELSKADSRDMTPA
jgi:hypothetical protein